MFKHERNYSTAQSNVVYHACEIKLNNICVDYYKIRFFNQIIY